MSLLTPSESAAFNGFLASVDTDEHSEWQTIGPDIANQIPQAEGTEALAKATKDLMSLDPRPVTDPFYDVRPSTSHVPSVTSSGTAWKGFAPGTSSSASQNRYHQGSTLHSSARLSGASKNDQAGSTSTPQEPLPDFHIFTSYSRPQSHSHSHRTRGYSHLPSARTHSDNFNISHLSSAHGSSSGTSAITSAVQERPGMTATSLSAPSVLHDAGSSTSSKRTLGPDSDPSASASKRPRPSLDTTTATTKSSKATSKTRRASESGPSAPVASSSGSVTTSPPPKPALLSPSQKRANHIQSEQKRRANIRRGYEALCEVVPPLREAIRLEELAAENERAELAKSGKARKRRKAGEEGEKADGRAGPKSENVVLQKSEYFLLRV